MPCSYYIAKGGREDDLHVENKIEASESLQPGFTDCFSRLVFAIESISPVLNLLVLDHRSHRRLLGPSWPSPRVLRTWQGQTQSANKD